MTVKLILDYILTSNINYPYIKLEATHTCNAKKKDEVISSSFKLTFLGNN